MVYTARTDGISFKRRKSQFSTCTLEIETRFGTCLVMLPSESHGNGDSRVE